MAAPGSSQVFAVPIIVKTGPFVNIDFTRVGPAGAALQKKLMEQIQEVIERVHPGGWPREVGEDGVARGYMLTAQEAEHMMREPPIGQHAPTTYVCNMFLEFISISHHANL